MIFYDQNGNAFVNAAASVSSCPAGFNAYGGIPQVLPIVTPPQASFNVPYLPYPPGPPGGCPTFAPPPSRCQQWQ